MKVSEIMSRDVAVCANTSPLSRAAQIMWERDVGFVPVVNAEGELIGTVTDRDVCNAAYTQGRSLADIPVEIAMARKVFSCGEGDTLEHVHGTMRRYQVRRLPVLDKTGKVVGVVSLANLVHGMSGRRLDDGDHEVALTLAEVTSPRALAARPEIAPNRGERRRNGAPPSSRR